MGLNIFGSSKKSSTSNNYDYSVGGDQFQGDFDASDNSVTNITDGGAFDVVGQAIDATSGSYNRLLDSVDQRDAVNADFIGNLFKNFSEETTRNDEILGDAVGSAMANIGSVSSDLAANFQSESARITENLTKWIVGGLVTVAAIGTLVYGVKAVKGK